MCPINVPQLQEGDAPPELALTAVPAALVEPDSEAAAAALSSGTAFPALQPADAAAAAEVLRAALRSAVAASPRAEAAGAPAGGRCFRCLPVVVGHRVLLSFCQPAVLSFWCGVCESPRHLQCRRSSPAAHDCSVHCRQAGRASCT